jgi:hypothetical protein
MFGSVSSFFFLRSGVRAGRKMERKQRKKKADERGGAGGRAARRVWLRLGGRKKASKNSAADARGCTPMLRCRLAAAAGAAQAFLENCPGLRRENQRQPAVLLPAALLDARHGDGPADRVAAKHLRAFACICG